MNNTTQCNQGQFTVPEVVKLINYTVIKNDRTTEFLPKNLGIIVGVLTLNDEVEMVVKFIDRICQFTKSEFNKQYRVIRE